MDDNKSKETVLKNKKKLKLQKILRTTTLQLKKSRDWKLKKKSFMQKIEIWMTTLLESKLDKAPMQTCTSVFTKK